MHDTNHCLGPGFGVLDIVGSRAVLVCYHMKRFLGEPT
jgi:hypothetical protein